MDGPPGFRGVPDIIYGTAFKFDDTATLVEAALNVGFRAIDTAANKPQYRESLVGDGIAAATNAGVVKRRELYIQTKFSPFKPDKDPALYSYDTTKSIPEMVEQSVSKSLANLGVTYIDSLVLHSLYPSMQDTLAAWKAMESLVPSKVSSLGLSNVDVESLRQVYDAATVKPSTVQNRFTRDTAPRPEADMPPGIPYPKCPYDRDVREFCQEHTITYVPWGVLWGNPAIMDDPEQMLDKTSEEIGISKQAAIYACMRSLGGCHLSILCGTTKEAKMKEAVDGLARLDSYLQESHEHKKTWKACVDYIKAIIADGCR